jgi:hypothetical protein
VPTLPGRAVGAVDAVPHVHGARGRARGHARAAGIITRVRHLAARRQPRAVDLLRTSVGRGMMREGKRENFGGFFFVWIFV